MTHDSISIQIPVLETATKFYYLFFRFHQLVCVRVPYQHQIIVWHSTTCRHLCVFLKKKWHLPLFFFFTALHTRRHVLNVPYFFRLWKKFFFLLPLLHDNKRKCGLTHPTDSFFQFVLVTVSVKALVFLSKFHFSPVCFIKKSTVGEKHRFFFPSHCEMSFFRWQSFRGIHAIYVLQNSLKYDLCCSKPRTRWVLRVRPLKSRPLPTKH